jgi:hypothetical protein
MNKKPKISKGKRIPSIPNTHIHSIPLNLYDAKLLTTPGHVPPAVHPLVLANMQAMNAMILNPLMYYWPLSQQQGMETNQERDDTMHRAATTIQRVFRGYRVRKSFVSLKLNPIMKETHPHVYYTELILQTILVDEIYEMLTDLSEERYLPLRRSEELKARRFLRHVFRGLIHEAACEVRGTVTASEDGPVPYYISVYEEILKEICVEFVHVNPIHSGFDPCTMQGTSARVQYGGSI